MPTPIPLLEPTIRFFGSQIDSTATTPLPYTGTPLTLIRHDLATFFLYIRCLPYILLPLSPFPSGSLDELYPSFQNLWCMFLHAVLAVAQSLFLLSIPVWFFTPLWMVGAFVAAFLALNEAACWGLNGGKAFYDSNPECVEGREERKDEQWIFMNGVSVGHHWLQANVDRLALTFGRPVRGVHNRTYGIIFDVIQCLIQRNLDYATNDVRECYMQIKASLYSDASKVVFILHSQGGIEGGMIIDWLLQEVPQDLLSKLEVYTFGNASNHFNNPYRHRSSQPSRSSSPLPKSSRTPSRSPPSDSKAIRYIEHYANSHDFVARWGVLHFTSPPPAPPARRPSSPTSTPPNPTMSKFMGRVFERAGSGHMMNQHYLDNMFPLRPDGRGVDDSDPLAFMNTEVVQAGSSPLSFCNGETGASIQAQGSDLLNGDANGSGNKNLGMARETCVQREDLDCSYRATNPIERTDQHVHVSSGSPVEPCTISWGHLRRTVRVRDLSRLWLYRDGLSPVDVVLVEGRDI